MRCILIIATPFPLNHRLLIASPFQLHVLLSGYLFTYLFICLFIIYLFVCFNYLVLPICTWLWGHPWSHREPGNVHTPNRSYFSSPGGH